MAAIIVVALKNMLLQILQVPSIYKTSKIEAVSSFFFSKNINFKNLIIFQLSWIITFLGVVVFDVDIGLYIGIGVSLLLVIIKSQRFIFYYKNKLL